MRIGLDIDNVITDFDKKLLAEFLKEDKNKRNRGIVNPNGNWIKDFFDWSKEEIEEFYHKNMESFAKQFEPRKDSKYYMDKLLQEGHSLYLISHRAYPDYTNPYQVTKKWLEENNINYTKLILSKDTNKTKECKENNIDIMFDDVRTNCRQLQENNINCYLMATNYNLKNIEGLKVVNNWKELYEVVTNMDKKKVILDTDMYNEVDDQFALTYLMKSLDVFDLEAITIAPFLKSGYANTETIEEGTEKSYETTLNILDMLNKTEYKEKVYKGATKYFNDSKETNEAVEKIIEIANKNNKTTILAIGAITNVALAIEKSPEIVNKIKVVWLGGNSFLTKDNSEFNFRQDIKAVQKVFDSKVELVVIPCRNVAANLSTTIYELKHYLSENTKLNKYLCEEFIKCKKSFMKEPADEIGSSKTLWDLSAIAYEINADWFKSEMISCPIVLDNGLYEQTTDRHQVIFVNDLYRNKIYQDFFIKMGE
ncbi:MAG: nucleoside hydrolase [Bacilli bacterium]